MARLEEVPRLDLQTQASSLPDTSIRLLATLSHSICTRTKLQDTL
jgi:hypothetical protein